MTKCKIKKDNLRVCVSCGHSSGNDETFTKEVYKLGCLIAKMGFCLDYGFSDSGLMGAVAKGVLDSWEPLKDKFYNNISPIVGITTQEYYSLYEKDEFLEKVTDVVLTETMEDRKKKLLNADIVVFAPGGVGTLDELAYDCVAMQDGFINNKPFILYNINGFFYHILEYLKEMSATGFAEKIPFIVVDNNDELETAFKLLKLKYNGCETFQEAYTHARELAYEMPYFIKRKKEGVEPVDLIAEIEKIEKSGSGDDIKSLLDDIDRAYLEKEIDRMYDRLARAGKDIAIISDKLTKLRESQHKQ